MAIETLDDILEYFADRAGVYGAHDDDVEGDDGCRICFLANMRDRIIHAVEVEKKLGMIEAPSHREPGSNGKS